MDTNTVLVRLFLGSNAMLKLAMASRCIFGMTWPNGCLLVFGFWHNGLITSGAVRGLFSHIF